MAQQYRIALALIIPHLTRSHSHPMGGAVRLILKVSPHQGKALRRCSKSTYQSAPRWILGALPRPLQHFVLCLPASSSWLDLHLLLAPLLVSGSTK